MDVVLGLAPDLDEFDVLWVLGPGDGAGAAPQPAAMMPATDASAMKRMLPRMRTTSLKSHIGRMAKNVLHIMGRRGLAHTGICRQEVEMRKRLRSSVGLGFLAGIALTLVVEASFIYSGGIAVTLRPSQTPEITDLAQRLAAPQWTQLQSQVMAGVRPVIQQQLVGMLDGAEVHVAGLTLALPTSVKTELERKMFALVDNTLHTFVRQRMTVRQVITPALVRGMLSHSVHDRLWVRVWGLPIPVTVRIAPR